ncbi:hypothetical protein OZ411_11515 [Bradyrhizobium sp. Arg237L]|uniref:hypothetical protein n=1 Tax=Bradyrhizobium sp. Arg237L TaxID=3003352 RepID=UPI00249EA551|nr:hypothetical protein [Bradyrhizobium sp. Arg237L]MDI4233442.1 hypothetical protein [Bradyrhizobium sp. Arg237L]
MSQQPPGAVVVVVAPSVGQGIASVGGEEPIGDDAGNGSDSAGLRPALPNSVEPKGIESERVPIGPTDDDVEIMGRTMLVVPRAPQPADECPDSPPPSKIAPGLLAMKQFSFPKLMAAPDCGSTGLVPGIASSVDPSGMPAGRIAEPVPEPSGEVRFGTGCTPGVTACALAGSDDIDSTASHSEVQAASAAIKDRRPDVRESWFRVDRSRPVIGRLSGG